MKRIAVPVCFAAILVAALVSGCAQAAPSPTPTSVPATQAKAAEPTKAAAPAVTKAPAAASTAAPTAAKKVDYPKSASSISVLVPFAAGGAMDIATRLVAPVMEKSLGAPIQVVNKAGGDTQVANTELAKAKPDGYTVLNTDIIANILTYVVTDRGTTYTRKNFQPVGMHYVASACWMVKADSPFKSVQDVIAAAKAKPGSIKVGDSGLGGPYHLANIGIQQLTGSDLTLVHFNGSAPSTTALIGGHIDVVTSSVTNATSSVKSGATRIIGVMAPKRDPFFPDIKTFEEQGFKWNAQTYYAFTVPTGTPAEIVDILGEAIDTALADENVKKRSAEASVMLTPGEPADVEAVWIAEEKQQAELMKLFQQAPK